MARTEFPVGPRRAKIIADGIWGAHERTTEKRRERLIAAVPGMNADEAYVQHYADERELDYYLTGQALAGALFVFFRVSHDE